MSNVCGMNLSFSSHYSNAMYICLFEQCVPCIRELIRYDPRPVTIGLQDCSQHWVGTTQSAEWHSSDSWPRWSGGTGTSGPKCCVWHHRPQYPARPHAASARNKWCCARMVWVVPHWAHSEDSNRWCLVTGQVPPLLCPPGLGPGSATLPHLHSPTPSPDTISWAAGAWICRWYSGLLAPGLRAAWLTYTCGCQPINSSLTPTRQRYWW